MTPAGEMVSQKLVVGHAEGKRPKFSDKYMAKMTKEEALLDQSRLQRLMQYVSFIRVLV